VGEDAFGSWASGGDGRESQRCVCARQSVWQPNTKPQRNNFRFLVRDCTFEDCVPVWIVSAGRACDPRIQSSIDLETLCCTSVILVS